MPKVNKFKAGDRVVAVSDATGLLKVGKVYTVKYSLFNSHGEDIVVIEGDYEGGKSPIHGVRACKFAKVKVVKAKQPVVDPHAPGAKLDNGKLQPLLITRDMAGALTAVIEVATFGAKKYSPGGWLLVENAGERYENAQERHALLRRQGELRDSESGLLHAAHEAWNALAKLELALRAAKE